MSRDRYRLSFDAVADVYDAERLEVDTIVGRVASVSAVAAASAEEQARVEERVRELVREREVDFPMITIVVVGDRV